MPGVTDGQAPYWPDAPMTEPWQGELFALAVHLGQQGLFSWSEWTAGFSAALDEERRAAPARGEDERYWSAWQRTLERLVAERAAVSPASVEATAEAWRRAYLSTPHGTPVRLDREERS